MFRIFAASLFLAGMAHAQFTVRIVTIAAPELTAIRAALLRSPADDNALRQELLPYFAEPVSDMLLRCGPGQSKLEALQETPYPTEFQPPDNIWKTVLPSAFATKNVGLTAEVEVKAGTGDRPATITVSMGKVTDDGRSEFPLPSTPASPPIAQPRFITDRVLAKFPVISGAWRLIGMSRPQPAVAAPGNSKRTLLTFVQVHDATAAKPAATVPAGHRLHFITFRIPAEEGMRLSTRSATDDRVLLDKMLHRAESGEISLTCHAACLLLDPEVSTNAPAFPAPSTSDGGDPFAQASTVSTAEAASILEFPYATGFDPDPSAFAARNAGHRLTVKDSMLEWESVSDAVNLLPVSPQPEAASASIPEFATQSLNLNVSMPPGSVRMAAAMLRPNDGSPRMMQVSFLTSAGPAAAPTIPFAEFHCTVFSLTPGDADRISALPPDRQIAAVQGLLSSGSASVLAWQCAAGPPGTDATVRCLTDTPSARGHKVQRHGSLLTPDNLSVHTLGETLAVKFPSATKPLDGEFTVSLDRPSLPTLEEFTAAADAGSPLPDVMPAKLILALGRGLDTPLRPNIPRLVFLPLSGLPRECPEHGRKHVALMLLRQ